MTRTIRLVLAGAIIAASCSAATAQTMRMNGTIEKADGNVLSLKSSDGAEVKLTLTENAMIIAVVKASMADIKEGTFLGSAAMPQPDGSQKALEVHIFPEQMRGTGEGHRPYAPVPNSTTMATTPFPKRINTRVPRNSASSSATRLCFI